MNKGKSLAAMLAIVAVPVCLQIARAQQPAAVPAATAPAELATSAASERALLDQYCVTCHNQRLKTAGLMLDQLDLARMHDHAEIWEKVVRKLRAGMMPPSGMPRPDRAGDGSDDHVHGEGTRSRRRPQSDPARHAPPQPHRIYECDSRRAGAPSGRHEIPAARRFDARVRQHRGRADAVAGA